MTDHIPSDGWSFDKRGPWWEHPRCSDPWAAAAATELDFDEIPTRDELESGAATCPLISVSDVPHAIALPDVYEPEYSYPLIVWLHAAGGSEDDVFDVLPQISERNYLALALRGNVELPHGAAWSTSAEGALELAQRIEDAVTSLAEYLQIHPERVYLAGVGTGGTTALELMLQRPELYAGAMCLGGAFPDVHLPLARFRGLRGRRVLLATTLECREVRVVDLVASGRLLYTAGMQVGTRVYQQGADSIPTPKMLRDIDHWLMDGIQSAVRVSVR
jgi:phospholipase/carboxylesterase